jgi:hypothetical protein
MSKHLLTLSSLLLITVLGRPGAALAASDPLVAANIQCDQHYGRIRLGPSPLVPSAPQRT